MGKLTREHAGLTWTYIEERGEWATPCGLRAWRCRDGRFTGGEADGYHPTLTAACEAEVAHREATRASPTLTPGELAEMLNEEAPADPMAQVVTLVLDGEAEEREAQRRDERAYYSSLAGWAVAVLVLAALCSGVVR